MARAAPRRAVPGPLIGRPSAPACRPDRNARIPKPGEDRVVSQDGEQSPRDQAQGRDLSFSARSSLCPCSAADAEAIAPSASSDSGMLSRRRSASQSSSSQGPGRPRPGRPGPPPAARLAAVDGRPWAWQNSQATRLLLLVTVDSTPEVIAGASLRSRAPQPASPDRDPAVTQRQNRTLRHRSPRSAMRGLRRSLPHGKGTGSRGEGGGRCRLRLGPARVPSG